MPLLTDAELAMLHALAAPIDANRRPEFLGAVTTKLEAAGPAAIGPGALHRTARRCCVIFGIRRRISIRVGSGLAGLGAPRAAKHYSLHPKMHPNRDLEAFWV
jgi:hypothetical protein